MHQHVFYNQVKSESSGISVRVTTEGFAGGWQRARWGTGQQRWLQSEAAWSLPLLSCPPGQASLLLEGGEMSQTLSAMFVLLFC